ncbi:activating signal cointegrator 1 complex subunit 2 [Iris pallida]|uniref:Activating signal cointegrator 1 complex subunit 2 n=1 Tax=Iris pallida TaxID=29817 RepID=A0AAX6EGL5_IRIPA|nr:activating signal cointegrator 1 complex subunit 2 [Iris pallida]
MEIMDMCIYSKIFWRQVMDFINDAVVTFDAFADAFNHAPLFLSLSFEMSYGNEELLSTLARLHDSFLPSLYQGFMVISNSGVDATSNISGGSLPNVTLSLRTLSMRIVSLGWKLLDFCYLRNDSIEDVLQSTTKMFPAKVDDPAIRGDIIVQTFRDINGQVLHNLPRSSGGTFLQNLEFSYNILRKIDGLRSSGWISIDEDQSQYLYQIATPPHLMSWEKEQKLPINSQNDKLPIDEDSVIIESKISQIKDLFPDYGKGFLSACLEVYNQNPEEVIQRILEGTLHNDLLSLDTSLEQVPPPKSVSQNQSYKGKGKLVEPISLNPSDKGKGKLVEPISLDPSDKGKGKLVEPISHSSNILPSKVDLAAARKAQESVYSSSSHGRFMRKSKGNVDGPDSEILDSMAAKDSIRSAVLAAEYDDEYDDSFDDLGLSVVGSGFEETENSSDVISSVGGSSSRWSKKKTQFYVKEGKNYSYKVAGSVAVSSSQEAALVSQAQKETIHGLGQGGNVPLGAVKKVIDAEEQDHQNFDAQENSDSGGSSFRGRGGRRGGGGGRGSHFRKDRAMKKHFQSLGGH